MSDQDPNHHRRDLDQATLEGAHTVQSRDSRQSLDVTDSNNSVSNSRPSISSGLRHRISHRRGTQQSDRDPAYTTSRDENNRQIFTLAGPSHPDQGNNARAQNQHNHM